MRSKPAGVPSFAAVAVVFGLTAISAGADPQWRKLPPLPGRADHVGSIALEEDTLWAMAGNSVARWDGSAWQLPAGPRLKAGMYLATFQASGKGPLFLSQPGEQEKTGQIFRLSDGAATLETEFQYDVAHERPGLFVTESGQILNLSKRNLRVYGGGNWAQAGAPDSPSLVFETAGLVHCYYPRAKKVFQIGPANAIQEKPVALAYEKTGSLVKGTRWRDDRALLLEYGRPGLKAFDLSTGDAVDVKLLNERVEERALFDCFRTRDGSAWLLATVGDASKYQLIRVRPDGTVEPLKDLPRFDWDNHQFIRLPASVLETKPGDLWLGGGHSLLRWRAGQANEFGVDTGYALQACSHLVVDSRGTVYAANSGGIYACYQSEDPPKSLPPPRRPLRLGAPKWSYRCEKHPPLVAAWKIGPTIFGVTQRGIVLDGTPKSAVSLIAVDVAAGELRYQKQLAEDVAAKPWIVGQTDKGVLEVATAKSLARFVSKTGEPAGEMALARDIRIAPLPVEDGYLVVPTQRGNELSRIDREGKTVWRCELPSYVMRHPAIYGNTVLVQTRGGSYGGQASVGIDVEQGSILWRDVTDAYGYGAAFFDDERFVVEADLSLSPERSEGWLICRDPKSGQRRWHFRQAGMLHHPPLIDGRTGRVYGIFDRGNVVCLRGEDGSVVWQQALSESAFSGGGANSYDPAWSPHSLVDGRLLVVDRNCVLHLLDAKTGDFLTSVALEYEDPKTGSPNAELIAAPWIVDDVVYVAFSKAVLAFSLPNKP